MDDPGTAAPDLDDIGYGWRREQLLEDADALRPCPADCGGQAHDEACWPQPERKTA